MQNAHHRMAVVEYESSSKSFSTRVQVYCDRVAHHKGYAHLLSVFGNDGEIAAVSAAITTGVQLKLRLPDGEKTAIHVGDRPTTFRGQLAVPGRPRPLRHLLAFSEVVTQNGKDGNVFCMHNDPALVWATVVSFLGLPAIPEWATRGMEMLQERKHIKQLQGVRCSPLIVSIPREELLAWIGEQVRVANLFLPVKSGPIEWPAYGIQDLLDGPRELDFLTAEAAGF